MYYVSTANYLLGIYTGIKFKNTKFFHQHCNRGLFILFLFIFIQFYFSRERERALKHVHVSGAAGKGREWGSGKGQRENATRAPR